VPDFPIPATWRGYSIRGINDHGDISGFFLSLSDPPTPPPPAIFRPFVKLAGEAPVEIQVPPMLSSPPANPVTPGTIWAISNDRKISGEYNDADGVFRGFTAKLKRDGTIKPSRFTEFPVQRIKSFNKRKDLLYVIRLGNAQIHFFEFGSGPLNGQEINISEHSIFGDFLPVMMNGISNSRRIAAFFGADPRQGFLGHFRRNGVLDLFVWSHPFSPTDTRLFSISNDGIVVGVMGEKKPFFMIAKNTRS
jgi:hypothetical protein